MEEATNKLSQINLNLFIVPNHAVKFNEFHSTTQESILQKLDILGIAHPAEEEDCVQVWIHDVEHEEDNCTDHGYVNEVIDTLEVTDRYLMYAPSYIPASVFVNVVEGNSKSWTSPVGVPVTIKFEQLPYRYRDHGTIEKVFAYVTR